MSSLVLRLLASLLLGRPAEAAEAASQRVAEAQYEKCVVYFGAFPGQDKVKRLNNIFSKSMETVRAFTADIPILFYYTLLDKEEPDAAFAQRLAEFGELVGPFITENLGSTKRWAERLRLRLPAAEQATALEQLSVVWETYPNPLRAIAWHEMAKRCRHAAYLDSDVLMFGSVQKLFDEALLKGTDITAPAEPNTVPYCREYEQIGVDYTGCVAGNPASAASLAAAVRENCGLSSDGSPEQLFQASVVVATDKALDHFASESFAEEYLLLCLRLHDGSREFKDTYFPETFWRAAPTTDRPSKVLSPIGVIRTGITSQMAMYVSFPCAGLSIGHFDRQMVFTGQLPSQALRDSWLLGEQPLAWHTQNPLMSDAVGWYPRWYAIHAAPGSRLLSWKSESAKASQPPTLVEFFNEGDKALAVSWLGDNQRVPQGQLSVRSGLRINTFVGHRFEVAVAEEEGGDEAATVVKVKGNGRIACLIDEARRKVDCTEAWRRVASAVEDSRQEL
eukprot:TRINITY_DN31685_c0_g1_i3.p1 TRINITY_DN31685_c0_g1~~TRINITY_DN31685_c0_g1_i3.p1  ORF type:complete len:505 (+),score=105.68 TRINITY_DN31685_c0_g1_i3:53-1567(+)